MSARTIFMPGNGRGIDLLDPQPDQIDFAMLAEQLAKEARYNGGTPNTFYSVAEHSVRGADVILIETRDATAAAYFVLHDGHEGVLRDETTPKKHAHAELAAAEFGVLAPQILEAYARLTDRHDAAIHAAAGLAWPPPLAIAETVKSVDLKLFVTEWRDLMHGIAHPAWELYQGIEPLPGKIVPMGWRSARYAFLDRCKRLLPALQSSVGTAREEARLCPPYVAGGAA
jgi:hypothetical protein